MSGGRGPGRGSLQTPGYGVGADLPGEVTVIGQMSGVRERPSEGVTSYSPPKPSQCGKKGGGSEVQRGRRGGAIPERLG